MLYLSTYFDKNYLSRGLVLYNSIKENTSDFELYILCLDEFTEEYFNSKKENFPEVKTLKLSDIEKNDTELLNSKSNRSKIEYYFTLSPCLPLYLLKKYNLPHICTLDADILFLNNIEINFEKLHQFSIIITPHKFSEELLHLKKYGTYNVSFQIFKNDEIGNKCLNLWRTQCLEYCSDEYDAINDRFADQKYLDNWLTLYPDSVYVLNDNVSGLATWNLNKFIIEKKEGNYYSNGEQIQFYHFHHFKIFAKKWASNGFNEYGVKTQKGIDELYLDYWKRIDVFNNQLAINNEGSSRYKTSNKLLPKLIKENELYKRKNGSLIHYNFNYIPKFVRKLIFKIYA